MKFIPALLILITLPAFARDVAKDINQLHMMDTFSCKASQKVQFRTGKRKLKTARQFLIPVKPGGYAKLHSRKLNMLFEAHFSEGVHFSLKQLDGLKAFPYKMKKKTDEKTYINVEVRSGKKKPVFTLKCKRR